MAAVLSRVSAPVPFLARLFGGVLLLLGFVLLAAGGWLASVGGSWYYALAGLSFAVIGGLMWGRLREAYFLYALFFLASLVWSLWEVGVDWWPLAARLDVPWIIGALMLVLLPRLHPAVPDTDPRRLRWSSRPSQALMLVLLAFVVVAVFSWTRDLHAQEGEIPDTAGAPAAGATAASDNVPAGEWHAYGRTGFGQRYSPLTQITTQNVSNLSMAWEFRTGDMRGQPGDPKETTFEVTPLKIGQRLFLCTPHQSVLALDATTGKELWRYDPKVQGQLALQHLTCRGLSYQAPPSASATAGTAAEVAAAASAPASAECPAKLFMPTADARLIALNPDTGKVCQSFGKGGAIDLWARITQPLLLSSTCAPHQDIHIKK